MQRISKIVKYQLRDTSRSVIVFYIVIAAVVIFGTVLPLLLPDSQFQFDGLKIATTIFLFVSGLNLFKSGFLFLQANGVTRRQFYQAGLFSIAAITVFMTLADSALYGILGLFMPINQGLSPMLYPGCGYAGSMLWTLMLNLLAIAVGWFITMLYYRSGKILKLVISFSPVAFFIGMLTISFATNGKWINSLVRLFHAVMGLTATPNVFIGALSMFVAATILAGLCFLLVRRAPIKEQDR